MGDLFDAFRKSTFYTYFILTLFLAGSTFFTLYNKWLFSK